MRQKKPRDASNKAMRILLISGGLVLLISGILLSSFLIKTSKNASSTQGAPSNGSTPTGISIQGHSNTPASAGTPASKPTATPPTRNKGKTYYVSKNGSNRSGTSWSTAWNELNRIPWPIIRPGDTIYIDGGTTNMVYTTTLSVTKSGQQGLPITIKRAPDTGHNGTVEIFGGNTQLLPYCGEPAANYTPPTTRNSDGIDMNASWVVIDGVSWHGIKIYGNGWLGGISMKNMNAPQGNDTFRNMEIYNNGTENLDSSTNTWYPDSPGINPRGANLVFEYMDIHDNGQDNFQTNGNVSGMIVQNSWLHYTRTVPGVPSESYNLCTHNDGLQIYGTVPSSHITFQNDILGPGLTNGLIFQPQTTNVTLQNSLVLDPGSNVTVENNSTSSNWTIDHVTAFGESDNLTLEGSGNTVTNSVFYDGHLLLNGSVSYSSNNCLWRTDGSAIQGRTADPEFVTDLSPYAIETTDITRYPTISFLEKADFSLRPGSPCRGLGSSLTSASQLI